MLALEVTIGWTEEHNKGALPSALTWISDAMMTPVSRPDLFSSSVWILITWPTM